MKKNEKFFIKFLPFLLILLFPFSVFSGEFRVTPIKLYFENGTRTGVLTIINEGETPLQLQVKAYEWVQDAKGKDNYKETDDIIYFPKIMNLDKGERRILRAGVQKADRPREKTYRLFIKEIPAARQKQAGTNIEIAVRFGVPIFVKPLKEEVKGEISGMEITDGKLSFDVKNTGNAHFRIQSIFIKGLDPSGKEKFSRELSGWYLLSGAQRSYQSPLSQTLCQESKTLNLEVKTKQFTLQDQFNVPDTLCMP